MELFAYRLMFHKETGEPYVQGVSNILDYSSERLNFDNFINSFISNFVILAINNWNGIMHMTYRRIDNLVNILGGD